MTAKTDVMIARLDEILAHLETIGALPATTGPEVVPLLDAHGNPGFVSPGDLIESSWGNAVVHRVVRIYPDKTALDAAGPSTASGELAATVDQNVIWLRYGGAWLPTALGNRPAFRIAGASPGQSVPASTNTRCLFSTEVSDPFNIVSGGEFTVPTGWAGRWMLEYAVRFEPAFDNTAREAWVQTPGGFQFGANIGTSTNSTRPVWVSGSASIVLTAGTTAAVYVYHENAVGAGTVTVNAIASTYFHGFYAGPA